METPRYTHTPVLLKPVLDALITNLDGLYLDATLGLGGHAQAILEKLSPRGRLLGLDMDPETLAQATQRLASFGPRFSAVKTNFESVAQALEAEHFFPLTGALFDLGISSLHFDKPERGFSFSYDGPLDMRLSPDNLLTAETIVNRWPLEQIELILTDYGEEPAAARIARAIVARRSSHPFSGTRDLASLIENAVPRSSGTHPATRSFMALRIAVNAELDNLSRGLERIVPYLKQGGRLCVITFHSLEDRIVKNIFASFAAQGKCRLLKMSGGGFMQRPSQLEIENNARARSAKLRALEKL